MGQLERIMVMKQVACVRILVSSASNPFQNEMVTFLHSFIESKDYILLKYYGVLSCAGIRPTLITFAEQFVYGSKCKVEY